MTNESSWRLEGPLTSAEVPARYRASLRWIEKDGLPGRIDLSGVEKTDSSALALLLEWQAWAHARNRSLAYVNPPEGLHVIARLCRISALLGWSETLE